MTKDSNQDDVFRSFEQDYYEPDDNRSARGLGVFSVVSLIAWCLFIAWLVSFYLF